MCEQTRKQFEAAYRRLHQYAKFERNGDGQYIDAGEREGWCMWCAGYNEAKSEVE